MAPTATLDNGRGPGLVSRASFMRQRVPILVSTLFCGALTIAALWQVLDTPRGQSAGPVAWSALLVFGCCFLFLFWSGVALNKRDAKRRSAAAAAVAARPTEAAREVAASFFPHAPDPGLGRDAAELLRVPEADRDAAWETNFYAAMAAAALVPTEPDEFVGPDEMPYVGFRLKPVGPAAASPTAPTAVLSLASVAGTLTERGLGAVLNPGPDHTADWVFSAGDLLSLRLSGRISTGPPPSDLPPAAADREALVASPSEGLLPAATRGALRRFMREQLGVTEPKLFMLVDATAHPPESLVFNVFPNRLAEGWDLPGALHCVSWFLPRHYRVISVPEDSTLTRHFQPL